MTEVEEEAITEGDISRGRQSQNKDHIECYKCGKKGHYQYDCTSTEDNAN